jgi:hypothetical protein
MKKYSIIVLLFLLSAILLLYSFRRSELSGMNKTLLNADTLPHALFESGDLIFRNGNGFTSGVFRKLSLNDQSYSHAGILHRRNGKLFVYHLIGGENNPNSVMRLEPLENFINPENSESFAVFRCDLDNRKIDSLAGSYFKAHVQFDMDFDLSTNDKMYCTELIYKILTQISEKDNFLPLTEMSGVSYVACDNIYLSEHMHKIYNSQNR